VRDVERVGVSVADSFDQLVERARRLAAGPGRAVIGVTGSPGAGKSTLVAVLLRHLDADAVAHVPMDGFHLADVALRRLGRLDAKGAPDTFDAGGYLAMLRRIRADAEDVIYAPAFERDLEQPLAGAIAVPRRARLVLTEGNYLLLDDPRWAPLRAELSEVWFCDPDPTARMAQLIARHVAFGKDPGHAAAWVAAVDDRNAVLVEASRPRADLIVPAAILAALGPQGDDI
jgi:pantothenate kinase